MIAWLLSIVMPTGVSQNGGVAVTYLPNVVNGTDNVKNLSQNVVGN